MTRIQYSWGELKQGLFSKKLVAIERTIEVHPGQDEQKVVNGLIMDIFNLFIARKMNFKKKDMPPMNLQVKYSSKDLLFVYAIDDGRLHLLALADRSSKVLVSVRLLITPAPGDPNEMGWEITRILDAIASPYSPGGQVTSRLV
jgi:hypothetical protein